MLIAMAGLPGAGKSTIAQVIGSRLGASVVSVDPLESAILKAGIDSGQPTGLAAYLVAETIAESVLVSGHDVIVDAVNAVDPAREQWVNLAQRQGVKLRFIEVSCPDPEIHRQRLANRERKFSRPTAVIRHAVEQSLEEYSTWAGSSGAVARITIDSTQPLGSNVEIALAFLED
jgi:predicted kinase